MNVKAPQPGMVIYGTDRFGNKMKVGSTVSRWAPQIAMLPDMTSMISKTFINEIDISKVKADQKVKSGN
jgi:HlyD family secretion protein